MSSNADDAQAKGTTQAGKSAGRKYKPRPCIVCGDVFEGRSARHWYCSKECKARAHYEMKSVITDKDYRELFARQDGRCAICGTKDPGGPKTHDRLYADHCHATGDSRGLLCHNCNRGLGLFADDPQRLLRAAAYLAGVGVRDLLAGAVERSCRQCGAPFRAKPSAVARGGGLYCSLPCYRESRKGRSNPRKGIRNPERWPPRVTVCARCGVSFEHRDRKKRKYCSPVCANAAQVRSTA